MSLFLMINDLSDCILFYFVDAHTARLYSKDGEIFGGPDGGLQKHGVCVY